MQLEGRRSKMGAVLHIDFYFQVKLFRLIVLDIIDPQTPHLDYRQVGTWSILYIKMASIRKSTIGRLFSQYNQCDHDQWKSRETRHLAVEAILCYVATDGPERRTSDILEQLEQWEKVLYPMI